MLIRFTVKVFTNSVFFLHFGFNIAEYHFCRLPRMIWKYLSKARMSKSREVLEKYPPSKQKKTGTDTQARGHTYVGVSRSCIRSHSPLTKTRMSIFYCTFSLQPSPPGYYWRVTPSCSCCLATPLHWGTKSASLFFCHSEQLSQGPCLWGRGSHLFFPFCLFVRTCGHWLKQTRWTTYNLMSTPKEKWINTLFRHMKDAGYLKPTVNLCLFKLFDISSVKTFLDSVLEE